jgi:hypothetical protein
MAEEALNDRIARRCRSTRRPRQRRPPEQIHHRGTIDAALLFRASGGQS